jgi:hypothetical protein
VCGQRGLADAILNVLMFIPLGLLARLLFRSAKAAVLFSLILAVGIESTQVVLPGRDASLGDVLFNLAGGGLGAIVLVPVRRCLRVGHRASARLSLLAALIVVAIHALTAWSLGLQLPRGRYFSFWNIELAHLAPTDARLTQVTLAGLPLQEGWTGESETVRRLLSAGHPLEIRLDPGEAPARLGGLYALYDDRQREVLLLGRVNDELVVRLHRRAARLRLGDPDIRVRGVFTRDGAGDRLTLRLERDRSGGSGYCATWSGGRESETASLATGPQRRCDLGFTLGRGWALLAYPHFLPEALRSLLDFVWTGLFFVPIGLWMRTRWEAVLGVALASASLFAVPFVSGLLPTPAYLFVAGAAGLGAGLPSIRRRLRERCPAQADSGRADGSR